MVTTSVRAWFGRGFGPPTSHVSAISGAPRIGLTPEAWRTFVPSGPRPSRTWSRFSASRVSAKALMREVAVPRDRRSDFVTGRETRSGPCRRDYRVALVVAAAAMAQQQPLSDSELSQHLTVVSTQIADTTIDPVRREELALDMAATLDRAAQSAADPEVRRQRWAQAIDLLDRFGRDNPDLPLARQLRFQAAVFRWAQAQTWRQAAAFQPGDATNRDRAVAMLDDAIGRLRSVSSLGDRTTLGENLRFRLAQALADRADLEPAGSPERRRGETEAMELLQQPATELGLAGYWHLLRADLARRTGDPAVAAKELDEAAKSKPAPPEPDLFDVRIPLQIGQKQFDEAVRTVDGSHLDAAMKGLWRVRIRLAELAGPPEGADRTRIAADLFREIQGLRPASRPSRGWR